MDNFKTTTGLGIICYGNILRSQVLEQYLRYHAGRMGIDIRCFSAGVAGDDEFPDKEKLFSEIRSELTKRKVPFSLNRNPWDPGVEERIMTADIIICADTDVKSVVIERTGRSADLHTFYEFIGEGESDFEDTYDYENKRQDPIRFGKAFDELERIALKILALY